MERRTDQKFLPGLYQNIFLVCTSRGAKCDRTVVENRYLFHVKHCILQIPKWNKESHLREAYNVPASKSILARDIVLFHRGGMGVDEIRRRLGTHLTPADFSGDVETLLSALGDPWMHDCGESGTTLRFLTAYFARQEGRHVIKGAPRLSERPMRGLIEVLEASGVEFEFPASAYAAPFVLTNRIGAPEYPPVIDARDFPSSQYVSALLLSGYTSQIVLGGNFQSKGYLDLTIREMERFGIPVKVSGHTVQISNPVATPKVGAFDLRGIGDWSSAWFLIEHLLLQPTLEGISVKGLMANSGQPDEVLFHKLENRFGLTVEERPDGLYFQKKQTEEISREDVTVDISQAPDAFLALSCITAGLGIPLRCTGISNLRGKESDRISACAKNIFRLGLGEVETQTGEDGLVLTPRKSHTDRAEIDGSGDHRVVMGFSVLAASPYFPGTAVVTDAEAVGKSFPGFWSELFPNTELRTHP